MIFSLFTTLSIVFIIICVLTGLIIGFIKTPSADYFSGNAKVIDYIMHSVFYGLIGLFVSSATLVTIKIFSSSDEVVDSGFSTQKIYALSNAKCRQAYMMRSFDKEYIYYNVKDGYGYIKTEKTEMDRSRFVVDGSIRIPYLEIHNMRYKTSGFAKYFFKVDGFYAYDLYVFHIRPDQIYDEVYYDISKY